MKKIFTLFCLCFVCAGLKAQPGALDKTFANDGRFIYAINSLPNIYFGAGYVVKVQPDGKILLAGYGVDYNLADYTQDFAIIRLNADGTVDNSFSDDGITFVDFSTADFFSDDIADNIIIQPDGKIVLSGYSYHYYYNDTTDTYNYYDMAVARLNSDGTPDNSFNGTGERLIDLSPYTGVTGFTNFNYDDCEESVLTSDGKIILAGSTTVYAEDGSYTYDGAIVRLQTDGSLDNGFDDDGIKILKLAGSDEIIISAALQGNGLLVLGGFIYSYSTGMNDLLVERLNRDGSPDNSFDGDGMAVIDAAGPLEYGYSILIQTDRKILLSGRYYSDYYTAGFLLLRLNGINGTVDNSFSDDGIQTYFNANESNYASKGLAVQQDGKIIQVGGYYNNFGSIYDGGFNYAVIRHNSNGSLDSSFGNYGRSTIDFANWVEGIYDFGVNCAIQDDGKIIAAGYTFGYIDNIYYDGASAARLLVDGESVSISAPPDQNVQAADGECGTALSGIDPILSPSNSTATVNYELYGATKGTGTGTLSGSTQFNIGTTTAIYSLADNPLNRAIFNINVTGGNNSAGGSLDFDGADDVVNLGDIYTYYSGQYSFEAWIKVRGYTNDDQTGSWIFGDERNLNGGIQVQLDTAGYITTFHPSLGFVKSTYKVPLDTWTHIAFVQSSSDLKLYVNGEFVQILLTAPNLHNTYLYNEQFLLGAFSSDFVNYTRHFNGEIDEVRFWYKAICQAQIQNNLHCEISGYVDGLAAYYKMNEGIAGCSNLETTYLNNEYGGGGTLENFALSGPTSNWEEGYITGSCAPFTPLSIVCPDPITVDLEPGQCSAIVNFSATVNAACGQNFTLSYSQDPGTYFNAGTSYVYVNANDEFGNYSSCSFPVTVSEHEPPVLVTKNITVSLDQYNNVYIDPYAVIESVSDNCGYDYYNLTAYPNYFDCNNMGDNIVTVSVTDYSGNTTTQYATVTITPFVSTSSVEVNPSPVQYSDMATFKATIDWGTFFYNSGCLSAPEVTFKLGSQVLGTVSMQPDYYNNYYNLVGTLDKQILLSELGTGSRKVTAVFGGTSNGSIVFDNKAFAKLDIRREDAGIEYTASQFLTTSCSTCTNTAVPFSAVITDSSDGYRGDIHNASAIVTITPVTAGASVIGDNTITVPVLTLVNNKNTSALLKGNFKVSTGANKKARFDITIQTGNYYTGKLTVPVFVSRGTGVATDEYVSSSPYSKKTEGITGFNVSAMPNPSHDQFSIKVQSGNSFEKINLRIMDIAGRIIESKKGISVDEIIQLGHEYKPGTYMVEVSQGQNRKLIKLVKL